MELLQVIHYIVVCWSGPRMVNPERYQKDRAVYARLHLESLCNLRHDLSRITFVFNRNPQEPPDYRAFVKSIPSRIRNAEVKVMERPNVGFSYGAYSDVFLMYRDADEFYMLMEDDYVFRKDGFDEIMVDLIRKREKVGWLTFALKDGGKEWLIGRIRKESPNADEVVRKVEPYLPDRFKYPQIALGLARSAALSDVWKAFGKLPHNDGAEKIQCKFEGQFGLATSIQKVGWDLDDMIPSVRALEHGPSGAILEHGSKEGPIFVVPVQTLL